MTKNQEQPHDRIFNILFQEDELTWQNIIYNLIRSEEMDPWDINISLITKKFLEKLKDLKEMDFRISGKIVLASSMLLKIKSTRLLETDLIAFDSILTASEEETMDYLEELSEDFGEKKDELPKIRPRIPQPRKRKVSVFDLVEALEQALEVENRRKQYITPNMKIEPPKKTKEITLIIKDVYDKIISFLSRSTTKMTFEELIPSDTKEDKVFTFIPLLHLDTERKIDLKQKEHFGQIYIHLNRKNKD